MPIVTEYLTRNPCYKSGRTIKVKGLMLHSIGCPQPNPRSFVGSWNSESYDRACVHGFIGADETIITLPCMEKAGTAMRGWHGGGSSNNTHIGVEMCEPKQIKYTGGASFTCSDRDAAIKYVKQVTENAVELFARLCLLHGLSPDVDIISHAEGYKMGIATNHGDPGHLWRGLKMDYDMDSFRRDVERRMEEIENDEEEENMARYKQLKDIPEWAKPTIEKLMNAGILCGDGSDPDGNEDIIDLSHDMMRVLILNYRGGCFDRQLIARGMEPAVKE